MLYILFLGAPGAPEMPVVIDGVDVFQDVDMRDFYDPDRVDKVNYEDVIVIDEKE